MQVSALFLEQCFLFILPLYLQGGSLISSLAHTSVRIRFLSHLWVCTSFKSNQSLIFQCLCTMMGHTSDTKKILHPMPRTKANREKIGEFVILPYILFGYFCFFSHNPMRLEGSHHTLGKTARLRYHSPDHLFLPLGSLLRKGMPASATSRRAHTQAPAELHPMEKASSLWIVVAFRAVAVL